MRCTDDAQGENMSQYAMELELLDDDLLSNVSGGADPGYNPADNARGRVGPGRSWRWLGNYYTPEALAHDNTVRNNGGGLMGHIRALPQLPAAAASYVRARLRPGPHDMQLPD
jgi:hypothetical protein